MSNPNNIGSINGRLANDPKVFENKDGSKKVLITVYVDRSYTDSEGKRISDALPLEAFVRAETKGLGPFSHVHKGDLVAVNYEARRDVFVKNGETKYELKLEIQNITFLESRAVTQSRLAGRINQAEQTNQALQAEAPAAAAAVSEAAPAAQAETVGATGEQLPF